MDFATHIPKDNFHHAYFIEGSTETVPALLEFLESCGIACQANPDVSILEYSTFGIDESRELGKQQIQTAVSSDAQSKKIYILTVGSFTSEAQQSLLKMFEEPAPGVHFFVITPDIETLLPTMKSRAQLIKNQNKENDSKPGQKFLDLSKPERLAYIAKIIKSHDKDENSVLLKEETLGLINSIETALYKGKNFQQLTQSDFLAFDELSKARDYLQMRGSSVKMILENLALVI